MTDSDPGSQSDEDKEPDRPLTIDDVPRLGSGAGIAVGCFILVLAAIAIFWFVRGWMLRG